jgi:hypothetical protein
MIFGAVILAAVMIFFPAFAAEAGAAKPKLPPYRSSGVIPGTSLLYEKLTINNKGEVKITIANPTNNGVAFTARFGFYDNRDRYLTGFTVEGFAPANRKIEYSLELDNFNAYRRATMMKVLGRGGRTGRNPHSGDGS